jgi:hypothetical protein
MVRDFTNLTPSHPDIKFKHNDRLFAIDKTNSYNKQPAFNLSYIWTYKKSNLIVCCRMGINYNQMILIKNLEDYFTSLL